ncbi:ABC transporter ATP-binding protein [Priestia taiwanensis]|uniref:ABC transporter ATP-binding protein n=1 Tax=Priestia taiwanensis TaxID=1347902 RepID=A0A917AXT8_9BACI|nr:ABC transporter ATP-binding protein [Priestia taiwanensis]MBM7365243.1 ABC-2 type transport system ATP-binding protein [Priestia taiwanensis]GGE85427.1 ABC transporter ATP-binding protein [Priestia taiwanensis]
MISIKDVSKAYKTQQALKRVSLTIQPSTCFGLIGPNGAGKSTLMKIVCGVLQEYNGEVTVRGINPAQYDQAVKKELGYVPQDIVLTEELSAIDNLRFFGGVYGLRGKELEQRMKEVLALVGLEERGKDKVSTFSGGMKRRINIGCALLHNPSVIVMDEPTVGIDPQSRNYIFDIILALKKEGKTIIYSSHYMEEVQYLCDDMALIDLGVVVESGNLMEIIQKHSKQGVYVEGQDIMKEQLQSFGMLIEKGNGYLVSSDTPLETLQQIATYVREHQLHVQRLELSQTSLEDIFLLLTGKKLRD